MALLERQMKNLTEISRGGLAANHWSKSYDVYTNKAVPAEDNLVSYFQMGSDTHKKFRDIMDAEKYREWRDELKERIFDH
jgi:hypothetical protein